MTGGTGQLNARYPAVANSVPLAREALGAFASRAGAQREQIDAVRLASSEALTNAVLHGYRDEPGLLYVTAALVSGELWVLIADDGCGLQPQTDRPGLGLGLALIAQASDEFTLHARASGGTEVRMRFDLAGNEPEFQAAASSLTEQPVAAAS